MTSARIVHRGFSIRRVVLGAGLLALSAGCAQLQRKPAELALTMTPAKTLYRPGEAVTVRVALRNKTARPLRVAALDHASVVFTVKPPGAPGPAALRFVEPVFGPREPAGKTVALNAGADSSATLVRAFTFTMLSMDRGPYRLAAVYDPAGPGDEKSSAKICAGPVRFTVEGEKAYVHRYRDGLLARQDAVALCAVRAGIKPADADSRVITDETGLQKYWVNMSVRGVLRAWLVDPYRAEVLHETLPFKAEDAPENEAAEPVPASH